MSSSAIRNDVSFLVKPMKPLTKESGQPSNAKLIPVFCVGETEAERNAGQTFSVLDKQVKKGLEGHSAGMI
jgi:triosephosphate isomerase